MANKLLHRIFLFIALAAIAFIAIYSLVLDYQFPEYQLNYFYSLFYLILSINFLGDVLDSSDRQERLKTLFKGKLNIFIYCLLSACFSIIFIHSGIPFLKTTLIILISFLVYFYSMFVFNKKITQILFWINFYLFMGMIIISQFPQINLDVISRYNPFGGLIVTLFI
jgi:hypothetical protein